MNLDLTLGLRDATDIKILSKSEVLQSSFANMKAYADDNNDPMKQKDLMYISFILCHEGDNKNGDYFFRDELLNCYKSPIYKAYDWEHDSPIIGVMTDANIVIPEEDSEDQRAYIEVGAVVWKYMFPKEAKMIAKYGPTGQLRNSMECWFEDYVYVVGEFGGEQEIYDRNERSELAKYVGKTLGGKPVYRGLKGVLFGGCGCVSNPADEDAIFKSVASKRNPLQVFDLIPDETEGAINLDGDKKIEEMQTEAEVVVPAEEKPEEVVAEVIPETVPVVEEPKEEETKPDETVPEPEVEKPEAEEELPADVVDALPDCANETVEASVEGEGVEDPPAETPESAEAEINYCDIESVMEHRLMRTEFDSLPYTIGDVIYNILWDNKITDKEATIAEQLDKFSVKMKELAGQMLAYYKEQGWASSYATTKQNLESTVSELTEKLATLQSAYDELVAGIEAEKAEKEAVALVDLRIADLSGAGLKLDDNTKAFISEQIKGMSEEQYIAYKNVLVNIRYASAETVETEVEQEETEVENTTDNSSDATTDNTIDQSTASAKPIGLYNVESDKTERNIFKEIASKIVKSN